MKRQKILLDKRDYRRVLLSDTLPSDSPIIYSNHGLYVNSHRACLTGGNVLDIIVRGFYKTIVSPDDLSIKGKNSIPLKFKILKNDIDFRSLSLLHPRAQNNFAEFYRDHADLILYLCSKSKFSIRAPQKIGGSMYVVDADIENKYREINIDTLETEIRNRYADSFFTYKGYKRLYKFYSSLEYLELERRFPKMWSIDVANCFDSVYTHSVSWASKNKDFIKENISKGLQVVNQIDQLMQRCNSNETNGIPIGSESSRVFAELIFQAIDQKILVELKDVHDLTFDDDYVILRYVDDFIIFAKSEAVLKTIYQTIADCLYGYRFTLNKEKMLKYERPFSTEHSAIITKLNLILKNFDQTIFSRDVIEIEDVASVLPIRYTSKYYKDFVNQVKSIVVGQPNGYSFVSSYLISALARKANRLVNLYSQNNNSDIAGIKKNLTVIIRIAFFFYSVYPSIPASQKLARTIWLIDHFFVENDKDSLPEVRTEIMSLIEDLSYDEHAPLESLNIILATASFGRNYLLSPEWFDRFVENPKNLNYFSIVSLLYYFQNHRCFSDAKEAIEAAVVKLVLRSSDFIGNIQTNSEAAHIFLDIMSCPFVSQELRVKLLRTYYRLTTSDTSKLNSEKINEVLDELLKTYWFVNWHELDILKLLERKELRDAY